jgi:hypothetical protein
MTGVGWRSQSLGHRLPTEIVRVRAITPPEASRSLRIRWPDGPVCEHGRIYEHPLGGPRRDATE